MPRRKLKLHLRFVLLFACLAADISIYSLLAVERSVVSAQSASSPQAPNMKEVYERAEKFLPAQASKLVRNLTIEPVWIDGTDRFVYRRQLPNQSKEFVLVDPERNTAQPAFDHARLAAALSPPQGGKAYTATTLPFERVTLSEKNGALEFNLGGKLWRCALADYKCGPGVEKDPSELPSPDGKWMAFVRDHNLWVRYTADGRERALTTDGEEAYSYATAFTGVDLLSVRRFNRKIQAQAAWSPDSTRLFTHRIDLRNVGKQHLLQSIPDAGDKVGEPRRPIIHSWSYAIAGDGAVPLMELTVIDVVTGRRIDLRTPRIPQLFPVMQVPQLGGLFASRNAFWHPDGTMVYVVEITRDQKTRRLWVANPSTGEPRLLIEEHSKTWVESPVPPRILAARKQILWWSDRSGWGHLYLHDLESGKLARQVTSGNWLVRAIPR
ncbi:MAG: DPP IV N-terminal domain-containing protein [Blastocatellia bacterium]